MKREPDKPWNLIPSNPFLWCVPCNGTGKVPYSKNMIDAEKINCPFCKGTGKSNENHKQ